uniref:Uncharacterized protein n=1 Tax=Ananas comosus var. bracteatus TaxID=296719 RepID=A0A6V7PW43_ANACO|nr:unnamed protein product [Ananas comosus var. bracteatus]
MEDWPSRPTQSSSALVARDGSSDDGHNSQLFPAIPALSEAAIYLSQTTSYITQCFSGFPEEGVLDEGQELVTLTRGQASDSSSLVNWSTIRDESNNASSDPSTHGDEGTSSSGSSSLSRTEPMSSTRFFQNRTSLFQEMATKGSGMPPVEDGTKRFLELLESVRKNEHKLPNSMVYLLVPGMFSNHGPLYFVRTKTYFSKMGLTCHIAKIHSEASVDKNAREIKEYIEEIYWGSKKRVLLLGHSKGGVDAAAALCLYWSDLKDKVAGLVLAQSPYGGSPIASDLLREGQLGDYVGLRKMLEILICKIIKGDLQSLEDLTYEKRKEFLRKHPLPRELPIVSFHTEASINPSVLATLSHVAHVELPIAASLVADGQPTRLPVVMPLAAAMAACAQLLQVRYGERSDGLVTRKDAEVPGSVVVRPARKLDHAWMVYSSMKDEPGEADTSQVCEALLALLVEVAQKRGHRIAMKDD